MLCDCGCGQEVIQKSKYYTSRYICGHNTKGKSLSSEHRESIRVAMQNYTGENNPACRPEVKQMISENKLAFWTQEKIDQRVATWRKNYLAGKFGLSGGYGRTKDEFISELGHYVRSKLEYQVCKILIDMNVKYIYEPGRFPLYEDNRMTTTYMPDIQVGNLMIEINGYDTVTKQKKMRMFSKQYQQYKFIEIPFSKLYDLKILRDYMSNILKRMKI